MQIETPQQNLPLKKQKIITSKPSKKIKKSASSKTRETDFCNKIEYLIGGFNFVQKNTKNLPLVTSQRAMNILLKLCRQEYRDYEVRKKNQDKELQTEEEKAKINQESKEECLLGKRDNYVLDAERSLDVRKLLKAENKKLKFLNSEDKMLDVVNEMGNSKERLENVIRVSKFRTKFLRMNIRKNLKEAAQEEERVVSSEEEMSDEEKVLLQHHIDVIECIFSAKIEVPAVIELVLEYLREEFFDEGNFYFRFMARKVFELIEGLEFTADEDLQAWERFVNVSNFFY